MKRSHAPTRQIPLAVLSCLALIPAYPQDIDDNAIREEDLQSLNGRGIAVTSWIPSGRTVALALLERYELVASGQFENLPTLPDGVGALNPHDVVVTFRILSLYKGVAADSIEVELSSDMLIFPGEAVSRYAKRQQVRQAQIAEWNALRRQFDELEESLATGAITPAAYESEHDRLTGIERQQVAENLATSSRQWYVSHGKTFYDLGGAIAPGEPYLIGVNRTRDRIAVYSLEEVPASPSIYWGERYEELDAALDDLVR